MIIIIIIMILAVLITVEEVTEILIISGRLRHCIYQSCQNCARVEQFVWTSVQEVEVVHGGGSGDLVVI